MSNSKKVNAKKPFKTQLTADFMRGIVDIAREHTVGYDGSYEASAKVIIDYILIDALEEAANNYCVSRTTWKLRSNQIENITSALEGIGYAVEIEKHPMGDRFYFITIRWEGEND